MAAGEPVEFQVVADSFVGRSSLREKRITEYNVSKARLDNTGITGSVTEEPYQPGGTFPALPTASRGLTVNRRVLWRFPTTIYLQKFITGIKEQN